MTIKDRISNDIKDAMRAREQQKLNTLRLVAAAVKQVEVDERIEVDETRMLVILDKLAKQRKESIAQFKTAGRDDLVIQEEYELGIINHYLPEPLSEQEIETLIAKAFADTGASQINDMGKVMALLKPQLQGRADLSKISLLVKTKLS